MAEVTGSIGNEAVELNNAATEATLKLLLQSSLTANKQTLDEIKKLASKTFKIDEKSLERFDSALKKSSDSSSLLTSSLGLVGGGFKVLGGTIGIVEGSLTRLSNIFGSVFKSMADGGGKVSDLTKPLEMLPGPFGALGKVVNSLIQYQEKNLAVYQDLTDSGIKFGGNLTQMRLAAQSTYMTLEDFTRVMKANGETFAKMGSTVDGGAKAFVNLSNTLLKSEAGTELRNLGYTTTQVNEGLANYISLTGGRTQQELRNTTAITKSASEYMAQLDALAEITGKSREEQEKQLKEQSANAAYEAYLQTLDEEGKKKATLAMQNALAVGGKAGADLLKSQLLGLPPMTEAAQKLQAVGPNVAAGINKMGEAVSTVGATVTDVNRGYAQAQYGATQDIQRLGGTVKALSFGSDSTAQALMSLQAQANRNTAQGIKSQEDVSKQFAEIANRRREVAASEAAAVVNAQKSFQEFSQSIMNVVMPIIGNLATKLMSFIGDNLPAIQEAFETLAVYVGEFAKNLMSKEGRDKIMNDIQYYFSLMMIELKRATLGKIGLYSEEAAERDRVLAAAEKSAFDSKAEAKRIEMENSAQIAAYEYKTNKTKQEEIDKSLAKNLADEEALKKKNTELSEKLSKEKDTLNALEKASIQKEIKDNEEKARQLNAKILQDKKTIELSKVESTVAAGKTASESAAGKKVAGTETLGKVEEFKKENENISGLAGAAAGAASLGAAGALIGSIVPVIGTAVGGALGATLGGVAGSLGLIRYGKEATSEDLKNKGIPGAKGSVADQLAAGTRPMAAGGIVTGPTLALVAEQSSPEAVIPLESGKLEAFLNPLFEKLKTTLPPMTGTPLKFDNDSTKQALESLQKMTLPPMTDAGQRMMAFSPETLSAIRGLSETRSQGMPVIGATEAPKTDLMSKLSSFINDFPKAVTEKVETASKTATTFAQGPANTVKSMENLQLEMQTLNKQTAEMIRYLRETADNSRRNVDAVRSLSGDLFKI